MIWIPILTLIAAVALLTVWCNGLTQRLDVLEPYAALGKTIIAEANRHGTITVKINSLNYHPENDT